MYYTENLRMFIICIPHLKIVTFFRLAFKDILILIRVEKSKRASVIYNPA